MSIAASGLVSSSSEATLKGLMRGAVIPLLWSKHCAKHRPGSVADLTDLLLTGDVDATVAAIGRRALLPLHATLFEPASRRLGDMWMNDECTEFNVTLGLCTLQTAVRRCEERLPTPAARPSSGAALVIVQPGELHGLGASLSAHVLRRRGWTVRCEFPSSDRALADNVASGWFDRLDIALSPALLRHDLLPTVARTIAVARRASRNQKLQVKVSGRVFTDRSTAVSEVGADG